jgi:hypothetical protein
MDSSNLICFSRAVIAGAAGGTLPILWIIALVKMRHQHDPVRAWITPFKIGFFLYITWGSRKRLIIIAIC